MITLHYEQVATNFNHYAGAMVKFKLFSPAMKAPVQYIGSLKGVGVGAILNTFVIAYMGHTHAVHYKDVEIVRDDNGLVKYSC